MALPLIQRLTAIQARQQFLRKAGNQDGRVLSGALQPEAALRRVDFCQREQDSPQEEEILFLALQNLLKQGDGSAALNVAQNLRRMMRRSGRE